MSSGSQGRRWRHCRNTLLIMSVALNLFLYFRVLCGEIESIREPDRAKLHCQKNDTVILIWFWPFGKHFPLNSCGSAFKIDGCFLTDDKSYYNKAHAVLIHHRDIAVDLSNLPKLPRPAFQKWIWMHFESPLNTDRIPGIENLFNVTMNYRRDADITVREQLILKAQRTSQGLPPGLMRKKDKLACWIVSSWKKAKDRVKYYEELKKHIRIETYGQAFGNPVTDEKYADTITRCKFYLSFENTKNCVDYMTEKLYNPLSLGSVPVVLGPPRWIYEKFVPRDSFIHVDDFASPKELADYLLHLNKSEEQYRDYFLWRKTYEVKSVSFPHEHACHACKYIRERNDYQAFRNLNNWYWDNAHV